MKYCTKCGKNLEENQTFCTSCGAKQAGSQSPDQHRTPRKPMSKKRKAGLFSLVIVFMLATGAHFVFSSMNDPLKTVQAMDRAVTEQNEKAFFNEVDVNEEALLDEKGYLAYLHSSGWENMRVRMTEEFENEEGQMFDFAIYDDSGGEAFTVKENPVLFGLYSDYEIEAVPHQVTASSNMENTSISVEGKTKKMKGEPEYEDLILAYPGEYEVEAKAKSEFGSFEFKDILNVQPNESNESEWAIDFPGDSYTIDTNEEEAILFLNGKSTGKPLSEFTEIGPFPEGEEVTVHAEWKDEKGKTHKTDKVEAHSDPWSSVSLYFEEPETDTAAYTSADTESSEEELFNEETVEAFMMQFLWQSVAALNAKDFSIVEPYFSTYGTGKEESRDFIESGRVNNETLLDGTLIDLKEVSDDKYEVTMSEDYIINYSDGDYKEPNLEATYTVIEEDDELKVDSFVEID